MDRLDQCEAGTIFILREAYARIGKMAMLWSMGKDSTALLWMVRKAFFGQVPFPLILLDTGMELPEVYAFRDRLAREWDLPVVSVPCPSESDVLTGDESTRTMPPATRAAARKTMGLRNLLAREGYDGVIVGIRRDEQSLRGKERVFSPRRADGTWDFRDQPPELWDRYTSDAPPGGHIRIHPILQWTEADIWRYTRRENIPFVPLYLARDGMRYRSLGESNITFPVASTADSIDAIIAELEQTNTPERAGRTMDHEAEDSFERLRTGGYM